MVKGTWRKNEAGLIGVVVAVALAAVADAELHVDLGEAHQVLPVRSLVLPFMRVQLLGTGVGDLHELAAQPPAKPDHCGRAASKLDDLDEVFRTGHCTSFSLCRRRIGCTQTQRHCGYGL